MSSLLDIVSEARSIKEKIYSPSPIREIVSPEVWLNPYYIGTFYHFMYDYWKPVFCDIVNKGVNEVVLGGSLGGGKSSVGELLILRKLYELSCYENIPALYGLPPTAQLIFMYLSVSVTQSERTGFGRLIRLIDDSPYMRENFPRETGLNSSIEFKKSKQIACYSGSDVSHFISMDLFAVILDEANFLRGAGGDAGKFSKASDIYRESTNRRKGRFTMGGIEHGISIIISSADTENSFTESRIEAGKINPKFYYKNTSILEVKRKDFSSEVFYVFPGVDNFDPFVLSEDNKDIADAFYKASGVPQEHFSYTIPPEEVKESFREVPIDFRETFNVDVVNSLKEVLGVSVRKMMRLYYSKQNWALCLDHTRKHPFKSARFVVSTLTENNELIDNFLPNEIHFEKNTLYFAHIDQSLKRDATGIALSHAVINEYGVLLKVVIDFMLQILAPKDISAEIDISKVRDFFLWLKTTFKIKYGLITYDMYACESGDTLVLTNKGHIKIEDINIGDLVYSRLGWKKVFNKIFYQDTPVMKLITNRGRVLKATPNHKIEILKKWVQKDWNCKRDSVWEFKRLDQLKKGDIVRITDKIDIDRKYQSCNIFTGKSSKVKGICWKVLNEDLALILGILHGDGCMTDSNVSFCASLGEESELLYLILSRIFNVDFKPMVREKECVFSFGSNDFVKGLKELGVILSGSSKKKIPDIVMKSPVSVISSYLSGLFATDGSVSGIKGNEGQVSLTSASFETVHQVQILLKDYYGINSSISSVNQSKYKNTKSNNLCYYLRLNGARDIFYKEIGFAYKNKQEKLKKFVKVRGRETFDRVKSVEFVGRDKVYDISVEDSPCYVANSFISHNSRESLQQFNKKGVPAELLSVDRDDKVYLETVHLLNKHQISMYNYPLFEWEFFNLKHFLDKRKVDHEEGYSKDLCLSGSVRVSLLSGREISLEEMYNSGKQFWVYSMSDKGLVVPGKTSSVQITGLEKELIRIWLDNGEYVDCTLNHRFMLRDGNYEVAFNLKEGMSLMSLCRKVNRNGYELIMDSDRSYNFTHRRVTDVVYGNVFQDECTHHKDGNKRNNVPENLKRMLISQHYYIHTNGVCIDGIQATRNRVTNLKKYNELEVTKKDQRLRVLKVQELRRQGLIKWNYDNQVKVLDRYRHTEKYKKEHRELVRRLIREGKLKSIQEAVQIRTNKSDLYKEGMTIENILNLRDLGFSNQEIANKLGVKIWAIERKITQARKAGMIIVKPIVTPYNHKIVKIEKLFKKETVYNFSVEPYNNFALSSGVFVHNSDGFVGSVYNCVSRLDLIGKNQTKRDNIAVFLGANARQDKMDYFNMERYMKR